MIFRLAPPVMAAQLIQALYNIVDSFFIGRCSEKVLTALSIVYPLQLLMIALAVGAGVGINTAMAFFFGIKKEKRAAETAGVGTPLAFAIWLLFARFGLYYFWLTYLITEIITSAVGFAMFSRFGNNTTTPCKV